MTLISRTLAGLTVLIFTAILLLPFGIDADQPPTRAPVLYSGSINGVGSSGDICLAGHTWYNISFSFLDTQMEGIEECGVMIKTGSNSQTLFDWNLTTPGVATTILLDQLSIRSPGLFSDDTNTTFHFEAFFHMNWDFDRQLTFLPKLLVNGTDQELDALSELSIEVHGILEPYTYTAETIDGDLIEEDDQVRANSTIVIKNIRFRYWHLTESLSSYSPKGSEMSLFFYDGVSTWNATLETGGYRIEVQIPDLLDERIDLKMDIPEMETKEWKVKIQPWKFSLSIDGLSPDISLRYPAVKEEDTAFQWEISITERPKNKMNVDGSTVQFRVFSYGEWSSWTPVPTVPDEKVITVRGSATGQIGSGNTSLQFKASDELGNENISMIYSIDINQGPIASRPLDIHGKTFFQNETLNIDGRTLVTDFDDSKLALDFLWYIDDDITPFSRNAEFNKSLFNMNEGEHSVRFVVRDKTEEDEITFNFTVKAVPVDEDKTTIMDILKDPTFLTIAIPILVMVLIVIVVVIIIVLSKKLRKADDFIINEDATMTTSQAEEMARKIRNLYEDVAAQHATSENDARIDMDDGKYDFDYNLYEVLDIEQTATDAEIKKKYRKLAAFYHPDRVATHKEIDPTEAAEEMVKINKAKEILLDPEFRADYDGYINELEFSMDLNEEEEDDDEDMDPDDVWG
jgi:hypothetical protein